MKKTFQLNIENKNKDRILEAIKHEIRKYIKREKRKTLPENVDFWDFKCKFGKNKDEPVEIKFVDITKNLDEASIENCESLYMEILSSEGHYKKEIKMIEENEENEVEIEESEESQEKDLS